MGREYRGRGVSRGKGDRGEGKVRVEGPLFIDPRYTPAVA